jgi:hypothetical protein
MISTFECDSAGDCELAQTASPSIADDTNIRVFVLDFELTRFGRPVASFVADYVADDSVRSVVRDGTEVLYVPPPPIYDY